MLGSSDEQSIFNEAYYKKQFDILLFMLSKALKDEIEPLEAKYTIPEIIEGILLKDQDEVLRALYIMEGQKLATPMPHGDFTSAHWGLTDYGYDIASKLLNGEVNQDELW